MTLYRKKKEKIYFIGVRKSDNKVILCLTKAQLARHIGVHPETIRRHLSKESMYDSSSYIIWRDIRAEKVKRGYGLRKRTRRY